MSPTLLAQGGQRVHFMYENDQWQARVREQIGAFSRTEVLPVYCERHGDVAAALRVLQDKPERRQQRIHVVTTKQHPYVPRFVFIGEQSLKGGMDGAPSGSGEPQGDLPAGEDAGAAGSRPRPSLIAQGHSTSWWALQERMAQEDIISTEDLVKALNEAQTLEEEQALQEWIHAYIEWFKGQEVCDLTPEDMQEYSSLAHTKADTEGKKKLLKKYFNKLCNKIDKKYQYGEEPLLQALEYTLQSIDREMFAGNPHSLIQLGKKLLAKLDPGSNEFSKATYPTHRSTLESLHQTLVLIKKLDSSQWDPTQKDGLYSRFKAQIKAIAESEQYYYPIRYQALLLEQVLKLLERPEEPLQELRRRAWHFLKGMTYLYQGTPIPGVGLKSNLDNLQQGIWSLALKAVIWASYPPRECPVTEREQFS